MRFECVVALTVSFGLGLSATIHFLNRMVRERRPRDDPAVAVERATVLIGPALILTTLRPLVRPRGARLLQSSGAPAVRLAQRRRHAGGARRRSPDPEAGRSPPSCGSPERGPPSIAALRRRRDLTRAEGTAQCPSISLHASVPRFSAGLVLALAVGAAPRLFGPVQAPRRPARSSLSSATGPAAARSSARTESASGSAAGRTTTSRSRARPCRRRSSAPAPATASTSTATSRLPDGPFRAPGGRTRATSRAS